jgi:hypothetical protein
MRNRFAPRQVAIAVAVLALGGGSPRAVTGCNNTVSDCSAVDNSTASHIQIGGPGSLSSTDSCGGFPSCDDPGRLDNGTIADALLNLTFDRAAARLSLTLSNATQTTASLTGIYFNVPAGVTGLSLLGGSLSKTCPPGASPCPVLSTWGVVLDPANIHADGFGRFDAHVGNGASPEQSSGGNAIEILAGETLSLMIATTGDLSAVTACSFTGEGSKIAPGDKTVIGVGRFQAGANNGDSAWLGPCTGSELLVELKFFEADPDDSRVTLRWETSSELDNAGFNVLRRPELGGPWERVNAALIPARGDALAGESYTFDHAGLMNGVRHEYKLEDIDLTGSSTLSPSILAVPNPKSPPIRLVAPDYGHLYGERDRITLAWTTGVRGPARLQFSADPSFPPSSRVEFPARASRRNGRYEMILNRHEQVLVGAVIARSETKQIYWRVVEAPKATGSAATSDVARLGVAR